MINETELLYLVVLIVLVLIVTFVLGKCESPRR